MHIFLRKAWPQQGSKVRLQCLQQAKHSVLSTFLVATLALAHPAVVSAASDTAAGRDELDLAGRNPSDPWEPMNRKILRFNDTLDGYFLKPLAIAYRGVTPKFMQHGVDNFFGNLGEIASIANNVLQWKWRKVGTHSGRLLLNSTVGLVGLVDVATPAGLEKLERETFGQTLSTWGLPQGPYLVLPFFGASTVTDAASMPVEWQLGVTQYVEDEESALVLKSLELTARRASLLDLEQLVTGDRYLFIREAFLQNREFNVRDGQVEDDFGEDLEGLDDF